MFVFPNARINDTPSFSSARCATTAAQNLSNDFMPGDVIDGITLVLGDKVLIKNQVSGTENGIYVVTAGTPTRNATDFAVGMSVADINVRIVEGTLLKDSCWVCTNNPGVDIVGTDVLVFQQVSGNGADGNMMGPLSSTNNAICKFNGITGMSVQNSGTLIDASENMTGTNNIQIKGAIKDTNSNNIVLFAPTSSAVDYVNISNSAVSSTVGPTISAVGTSTNIPFSINGKGTGNVILSTIKYPITDGTNGQVLTTDGNKNLSFTTVGGGSNDSEYKNKVRVATVATGTLATSFAAGQVIDGITLVLGDRILIKNQGSNQNGIYVVTAGTPTRATDLAVGVSASGTTVYVSQGTANATTVWICTNAIGADIVGTATLIFTLSFNGASNVYGGVWIVQDLKTQGSNGGSTVANAWTIRVLQTTFGNATFGSLAANQMTLQPGKYRVQGFSLMRFSGTYASRIQNITAGTTLGYGCPIVNNASSIQLPAIMDFYIVLTQVSVLELQYRATRVQATTGLGGPSGVGLELYASVAFTAV